MKRDDLFLLAIAGAVAYVIYQQTQTPSDDTSSDATSFTSDPLASLSDIVVSSVAGWKSVGDASQWLPALAAAEQQYGIPTDLLARIAYEESRFRTDIITGAKVSSAGALGLMQLMPQYFPSVRVPRPFTAQDTLNQIDAAAQLLSSDYATLGDWSQAVAAYNAGLNTIQKGNASAANKARTAQYVADIIADVPAVNA